MTNVFDQLMSSAEVGGRFYGVAIGIVTNNKDPDGLGRVKLKLPWMSDDVESNWARIATPMAGRGRGAYFLPEVDDEVLVAFEHGSPEFPYVLGGLWNGKDKPPETNSDGKNDVRVIKSRSGHVIRLTDTRGSEQIEIIDKSTKNSIVISTKDNKITITADADVVIQATNGKLQLSGTGVEITSQADVKIEAKSSLALKSNAQLNIKGRIVNIN
ncbi:MAG: phage baseplate assembly protein V [Pseudonocardiaceae bacterium]